MGAVLRDSHCFANRLKLRGSRESSTLDVDRDCHSHQLRNDEMRRLDQQQARLRLDLRVVKRSPGERDRRPLPVDETLPRRVARPAHAVEPQVEQSEGRPMPLGKPQRQDS